MEITLDTILGILGLFIGGGGGAFFTWRWQRKKAKAEAKTAEADAAKELQDVYQQLIQDIKTDRDDLRKRQDELEESVRSLQREVARYGRMVANMRPFLCGRTNCPNRVLVTISDDGEAETESNTQTS